jgi:hypothetical protein
MDAQAVRTNASRPVLSTGIAQELTLDTSSISAESAAEMITAHLRRLMR